MNWRIPTIMLIVLTIFQFLQVDSTIAAEKESARAGSKSQTDKKDAKAKEKAKKPKFIGFVDKNRDGINDKFHDANGDGINDVTKKKYDHRFKFVDKNKDKINDVFVDKDGDGVNDLETKLVDEDKDGVNDNVLDYNKDSFNDITGLKYKNKDLMGYRYGIVEEEAKKTHKKFIDENGDGMHDPVARQRSFTDEDGDGIHDQFVDKDGDGIRDGRRIRRQRRRRGQGGMGRGGRGQGRGRGRQ
ncbi:hypothetical protein ACFL6S_30445 [Candidatus Poribacteria bacterium]